MANEQMTETLVRKLMAFENGGNQGFNVYPQGDTEDLYELNECLLKAGGKPDFCALNEINDEKRRTKAKPEYLIVFDDDPNLVIVIECKKNKKNHISETLNQPKKYAVDGVLYYAKYLKESFRVIAIAVSGTKEDDLLSNAYIWNKQEETYTEITKLRNILISPLNVKNILEKQKLVQSYSLKTIKEKANEYNLLMRDTLKIIPQQRIMFIAGCLLSLQDDTFKAEYNSRTSSYSLVEGMYSALERVLKKAGINQEKIDLIKHGCNFGSCQALMNMPLMQKGSLLFFLKELELTILPMINDDANHQDALGVFYHEFIKYTAGGAGNELGIVLTPSHLCDFMCELADLRDSDTVIDICCGTGSFLVSAMNKMFENANEQKIKEIKRNQLYGIEIQDSIFTIATTNMIIRGDGQSHIYHNNCFDISKNLNLITNNEKTPKFTVGLINPPYSQKSNNETELNFVNTMLNMLQPRGIGVVVVPMSCAIGTKFKEDRRRLMENHTLKAVFSMPDDIFYPTGTNVCVMVWEAHKPHGIIKNNSLIPNEETFFGYYKDDGFEKRKHLGRVDINNKWEKIKGYWIDLYKNKTEKIGYTCKKKVSDTDEWLVEAYMQIDYSQLTNDSFQQTLNKHIAYRISSNQYPVLTESKKSISLKLDVSKWHEFMLEELFIHQCGVRLTKIDREKGNLPFVTAKEFNNGVADFISNEVQIYEDKITIDMFCNAFYQNKTFGCDDNILVLIEKEKISAQAKIFVSAVISLDKVRYKYGRQYRQKNFKQHKIKLPAIKNEKGIYEPDWEYMENYIKSLPYGDLL